MDGQGSINSEGKQATFNLHELSGDRPSGSLSYNAAAVGISLQNAKIRTLSFIGSSADLGGTARLGDGSRVSFSVR